MIDKKVLQQMGFQELQGGRVPGREVWEHAKYRCLVQFGDGQYPIPETELRFESSYCECDIESGHYVELNVQGEKETMERFFELFLEHYANLVFVYCHIARTEIGT